MQHDCHYLVRFHLPHVPHEVAPESKEVGFTATRLTCFYYECIVEYILVVSLKGHISWGPCNILLPYVCHSQVTLKVSLLFVPEKLLFFFFFFFFTFYGKYIIRLAKKQLRFGGMQGWVHPRDKKRLQVFIKCSYLWILNLCAKFVDVTFPFLPKTTFKGNFTPTPL